MVLLEKGVDSLVDSIYLGDSEDNPKAPSIG
jgi:hypothetical protein